MITILLIISPISTVIYTLVYRHHLKRYTTYGLVSMKTFLLVILQISSLKFQLTIYVNRLPDSNMKSLMDFAVPTLTILFVGSHKLKVLISLKSNAMFVHGHTP